MHITEKKRATDSILNILLHFCNPMTVLSKRQPRLFHMHNIKARREEVKLGEKYKEVFFFTEEAPPKKTAQQQRLEGTTKSGCGSSYRTLSLPPFN